MSGEEDMIPCPYNLAHVILKPRMAAHLIKCRQQYPVEKFETCPFNTTHDVPAPELEYHIGVCPDRREFERQIYVMDDSEPEIETAINIELPTTSENWDEELTGATSYLNVKDQAVEKEKLFRLPVGMSKSKKKTFFQNESKKFGRGSIPRHLEGSSK